MLSTPLWHAQRGHWHRCATNFFRISLRITDTLFLYKEIWLGSTLHSCVIDTPCDLHSGVIDIPVTCTAVPMTLLCKYDTAVTLGLIFERLCTAKRARGEVSFDSLNVKNASKLSCYTSPEAYLSHLISKMTNTLFNFLSDKYAAGEASLDNCEAYLSFC
jgi:hypothetical protein